MMMHASSSNSNGFDSLKIDSTHFYMGLKLDFLNIETLSNILQMQRASKTMKS